MHLFVLCYLSCYGESSLGSLMLKRDVTDPTDVFGHFLAFFFGVYLGLKGNELMHMMYLHHIHPFP